MGKIQKMIDYAVSVAKDDSHGYSQARRWPDEGTDFDCSSLMYEAADHAGYKVKRGWPRYTGSMLADFKAAGFKALPFDGNLNDLDPGDILLNVANHTEMYIGDGKFVGAHSSENGTADGRPGDQTGDEISIVNAYTQRYGWDNNSQQVSVSGVTASNAVLVVPAPASSVDWATCGVMCTAQSTNSLTFTCSTTPSSAIKVNIHIGG